MRADSRPLYSKPIWWLRVRPYNATQGHSEPL